MKNLNKEVHNIPDRPIRIIQFGEGNFLRAFCDWIIQDLNDKGVINSSVAVVQPMPQGRVEDLEKQDGLYTLCLEGIDQGKTVKTRRIIDVLKDFVNPYTQYQKYLNLAKNPDLQVVISNTTEAGIALDALDTDFSKCPESFPGKLLAFLRERYEFFKGDKAKGLAIIPCELIDNNGKELKETLLKLSNIKGYDAKFTDWLQNACQYSGTLVDRIVPGYPRAEIDAIQAECGYIDSSVVKGEIFHLWVLEKNELVQKYFPADKSGLNVIFTDDITPYKQRKVKILNGSHTAVVPIAYLAGKETVRDAVTDPIISDFIKRLIFSEINPTIKLPADEMKAFADSVLERYLNPFIRHELMSIALNSTTKFTTRLLPSLEDYIKIKKDVPHNLLFAFAALIVFHKGDRNGAAIALNDNPAYLERWKNVWEKHGKDAAALCKEVCGWADIWGIDIAKLHSNLITELTKNVQNILNKGMYKALGDFCNG